MALDKNRMYLDRKSVNPHMISVQNLIQAHKKSEFWCIKNQDSGAEFWFIKNHIPNSFIQFLDYRFH